MPLWGLGRRHTHMCRGDDDGDDDDNDDDNRDDNLLLEGLLPLAGLS